MESQVGSMLIGIAIGIIIGGILALRQLDAWEDEE